MRLTDLNIKTLKAPAKGAVIYHDDVLTGFGVRVSEGGTMSFVLTHGALRRRETIGRVGVVKLQDARIEAKRRLAEYTLGKSLPRAVSWNTALSEYLAELNATKKARTCRDYSRMLKKHFRFGDLRVSDISKEDIERSLNRLSHTPAERHHAFAVLRTFFIWAHARSYLDANPMERMRTTWKYKPRERVLSDAELRQVWLAAEDNTFGHIVRLLILTGQRVGEISKLTPSMVEADCVVLPSLLTKNGREHRFPLGALTRSILMRSASPERAGADRLLFSARGRPDAPFSGFSKSKAALDRACGVEAWTLHDLRRTFATGLAGRGVQLPVIERLLNHVSGSFGGIVGVYQRYDFMPEMRDALEKWESHIRTIGCR